MVAQSRGSISRIHTVILVNCYLLRGMCKILVDLLQFTIVNIYLVKSFHLAGDATNNCFESLFDYLSAVVRVLGRTSYIDTLLWRSYGRLHDRN